MYGRTLRTSLTSAGILAALTLPSPALAQGGGNPPSTVASGEDYRIEVSGAIWRPTLSGLIRSEQFGIAGSDVDFVSDLGYKATQFADGRLVLKAGKRHRFRVQYTPISYSADSMLTRDIIFNGIRYSKDVPIQSSFDWKVWRFGYQFDFISTDSESIGLIIEGRYTEMNSRLTSSLNDEFTSAKAPLPAFGLVGRVYPLPSLSLTAEFTGFKLPGFSDDYEANYIDIDVYGTFNFTRNLGVQGGFRRMTTFLRVETDTGDFRFEGIWFGGVLRY